MSVVGGHDHSNYRGFTGHDMLDNLGLIHMGGRVYDPDAGRFLSADIIVQTPGNSQSYNRYSYVLNNPLSLIDPTGYRGVSTENTANKSPPAILEKVRVEGSVTKEYANRWADNFAQNLIMSAVANHQRSFTAPLPGGGVVTFNSSRSTYNTVRNQINSSKSAAAKSAAVEGVGGEGAGDENGEGLDLDTQKGSLRETKAQKELRLAGDVEGYYKARAAAGDKYAARALMVIQNEYGCCSAEKLDKSVMALANFGLHGKAFINGVEVSTQDVQLRLMNAHADFVANDNQGIPGLLNSQQIAAYHQVFGQLGLSRATFGGTPVTGFVWEADVWSGIWCKGCDTQ